MKEVYKSKAAKMKHEKKESPAKKKMEAKTDTHKMANGKTMKNSAMKKGS
jgi:hypothetical protein